MKKTITLPIELREAKAEDFVVTNVSAGKEKRLYGTVFYIVKDDGYMGPYSYGLDTSKILNDHFKHGHVYVVKRNMEQYLPNNNPFKRAMDSWANTPHEFKLMIPKKFFEQKNITADILKDYSGVIETDTHYVLSYVHAEMLGIINHFIIKELVS